MGDLLIRNISDAVKTGLANKAKQSGRSLSDEVKLRLSKSLAEEDAGARKYENAYEAIRSAFVEADALMTDEEHAEFMRAIEQGRQDAGRLVPDFE
jgi:antitoxin FitA